MKTKRKSLGQFAWRVMTRYRCPMTWADIPPDTRKNCERIASRIRREVIKRELEKAEDAFGVRAIHGERLERARVMLESRRREKARAAVILGRDK